MENTNSNIDPTQEVNDYPLPSAETANMPPLSPDQPVPTLSSVSQPTLTPSPTIPPATIPSLQQSTPIATNEHPTQNTANNQNNKLTVDQNDDQSNFFKINH